MTQQIFRPYTIATEKRVYWALKTISAGLRGDGPYITERAKDLTADGIATKLLVEAIETKWPGLLDGYKRREAVDREYENMIHIAQFGQPKEQE